MFTFSIAKLAEAVGRFSRVYCKMSLVCVIILIVLLLLLSMAIIIRKWIYIKLLAQHPPKSGSKHDLKLPTSSDFFHSIQALMTFSCWSAVKQQLTHLLSHPKSNISFQDNWGIGFCRFIISCVFSRVVSFVFQSLESSIAGLRIAWIN